MMASPASTAAVQWLASGATKEQVAFVSTNPVSVKVEGDVVKEPNAVARALAKALCPSLLGASPVEQAQVAQWQAWTAASQEEGFGAEAAEVNEVLATRSFLAGQRLTLADVQVFLALASGVSKTLPGPANGLTHLTRWFDHIQNALRTGAFAGHGASLLPEPVPVHSIYKPVAMPVFTKEGTGGAGVEQQQGKEKGAQPQQPKQPPPPKEGGQGKGGGAKERGVKEGGDEAAKAKSGKKGGAACAAPAAAAEEKLDNPNHLLMRVGKIVKAWPHPESEKLWCEEIDLGEAAPRQIASGLRQFYAEASDLEGRLVLVLANLKPRKLAGFTSNGMVLCASNASHTEVKFVEVPPSAKVGDRVVFPGDAVGPVVDAMEPNKLQKKKVFEAIAPDLVTDAEGVCRFRGVAFTLEGTADVCTAPLPNAHVS